MEDGRFRVGASITVAEIGVIFGLFWDKNRLKTGIAGYVGLIFREISGIFRIFNTKTPRLRDTKNTKSLYQAEGGPQITQNYADVILLARGTGDGRETGGQGDKETGRQGDRETGRWGMTNDK
jgi:hypothetical protein